VRSPSIVGAAVFVAAVAVTHASVAAETAAPSYDAPLFGVNLAYGARSGWGGPDAAIVGGGLFAGGRWGQSGSWRAGVLGDASYWRADPGVAVDFGGFISWDAAAIWLDTQISAAWFWQLEPTTFQWVSSTSRWAYTPALGTGVRALGFTIGLVGRPEFGLEDVPTGSRLGVDVELRIGVDFVEFARFLQHMSGANQPLAP
jgi:hypothetical protein